MTQNISDKQKIIQYVGISPKWRDKNIKCDSKNKKPKLSKGKKNYTEDTLWEIFDSLESIFHNTFKHYLRKIYSLKVNYMFQLVTYNM